MHADHGMIMNEDKSSHLYLDFINLAILLANVSVNHTSAPASDLPKLRLLLAE